MRGIAIPLILGMVLIALGSRPPFLVLGLGLVMTGLAFAVMDILGRRRQAEDFGPAIPRPGLVLIASSLALAAAVVMVLLLANGTTGFGGPDYSGAWPGFALGTFAFFGIALGIVGLGRRAR
jgi:hypothetical protein